MTKQRLYEIFVPLLFLRFKKTVNTHGGIPLIFSNLLVMRLLLQHSYFFLGPPQVVFLDLTLWQCLMCDIIVLFSLTLMAGGSRLLVQLVAAILVMFSRVRGSLPQRMSAIVSIVFPSSLHRQILNHRTWDVMVITALYPSCIVDMMLC